MQQARGNCHLASSAIPRSLCTADVVRRRCDSSWGESLSSLSTSPPPLSPSYLPGFPALSGCLENHGGTAVPRPKQDWIEQRHICIPLLLPRWVPPHQCVDTSLSSSLQQTVYTQPDNAKTPQFFSFLSLKIHRRSIKDGRWHQTHFIFQTQDPNLLPIVDVSNLPTRERAGRFHLEVGPVCFL